MFHLEKMSLNLVGKAAGLSRREARCAVLLRWSTNLHLRERWGNDRLLTDGCLGLETLCFQPKKNTFSKDRIPHWSWFDVFPCIFINRRGGALMPAVQPAVQLFITSVIGAVSNARYTCRYIDSEQHLPDALAFPTRSGLISIGFPLYAANLYTYM